MDKRKLFGVPDYNVEVEVVKILEDGEILSSINISAGFLFLNSYVITPAEISADEKFLHDFVNSFTIGNMFVGEYKEMCVRFLVEANIWDCEEKLSEEQLDYLRSKLGDSEVDRNIEKYGDDFRYLGAKKAIELKELTFSNVWFALQVLIYSDYYKNEFLAGASWAMQTQKVFREDHYLEAELEMVKAAKIKEKAGAMGGRSATGKREQRIGAMLSKMEGLVADNPVLTQQTMRLSLASLAIENAIKANPTLWSQGKDQRDNYLSAMQTDEPFKERFAALGLQ